MRPAAPCRWTSLAAGRTRSPCRWWRPSASKRGATTASRPRSPPRGLPSPSVSEPSCACGSRRTSTSTRSAGDWASRKCRSRASCERPSASCSTPCRRRATGRRLRADTAVCVGGPGVRARGGGDSMSLIDKLTGRAKQAAGDLTGDRSLQREGRKEETKGEKKEELGRAEERVEDKAQQVGELERDT